MAGDTYALLCVWMYACVFTSVYAILNVCLYINIYACTRYAYTSVVYV